MPDDPAHHLNFLKCQADFTYSITVKEIKIQGDAPNYTNIQPVVHISKVLMG